MNPHRLTWGIAYSFPIALCVGVATLLGSVFVMGRNKLPKEREMLILFLLCMLFTLNNLFALFPLLAWKKWEQVIKIMLMTFLTAWLIDDKKKLRYLLFVITLSVGFFSIKAIPWAIATGGRYMLRGPDRSFLATNNSIGMALNMVMPLMLFLARNEANKKIRLFYYGMFCCSIVGVILTYSRGALVGLSAVTLMLFLRSKKKYLAPVGLVLAILFLTSYVPQKWFDRMETIPNYQQDGSAMSRLATWGFAWNLALEHPLTGGGFEAFRANPTDFDAHSIYFGMLAEQGFIAFGLFGALIISSYISLSAIKKKARRIESCRWYADCASMLQVSIVAYLVNGITLNHQYFDLFYVLIALVIILKALVKREIVVVREIAGQSQLRGVSNKQPPSRVILRKLRT